MARQRLTTAQALDELALLGGGSTIVITGQVEGGGAEATPAVCARYRQIERDQYKFVMIYQTLILILAVAAAALIIWAIVLVATNQPWVQSVIAGGAGVVSGALMAFPLNQRADARTMHAAALQKLEESGCPALV